MGRIVINLNRARKGDRHGKLEVRCFYDQDVADDFALHNALVELFHMWTEALPSVIPDARIINEERRK